MVKNNLHSFAVLAYKNSPYLEECILSLKNQTVQSDIYITTATPSQFLEDIARRHGVQLIIKRYSNGIASDWSFAYNYCENEYVTLAHQDDIYLPRYTELCLKEAKKHSPNKELIIFTGYKDFIGTKARTFAPHIFIKGILLFPFLVKRDISSSFIRKSVLSFGNPIACPTVMYHREELGKFEFAEEFSCNMDWDAWLRLSELKGNFIYIKDNLVLHRINKDSQTSRQIDNNRRQKEDRLIFERLWPKPMAMLLASFYSLATKFNETK